jgi:hypothetical protein
VGEKERESRVVIEGRKLSRTTAQKEERRERSD